MILYFVSFILKASILHPVVSKLDRHGYTDWDLMRQTVPNGPVNKLYSGSTSVSMKKWQNVLKVSYMYLAK